jgi:hypothetical protein
MSERAEEGRQGWIVDATWVLIYSMLVLLLMIVWVRSGVKLTAAPGKDGTMILLASLISPR